MKILIVDDDLSLIELLQNNLLDEGWDVVSASDGEQAIEVVRMESPDLVVLDIMMPGMDGIEACRILVSHYSVPIIMLSARGEVIDKVTCLNYGADDYLTKPFEVAELVARIKAVMRRNQPDDDRSMTFFRSGSITIDFESRKVDVNGKEIRLTHTENRLLRVLVVNTGKTMSYGYLLNTIWGPEYRAEREYLHVYIGHLRAKIEPDPKNPQYIILKPNVGYFFMSDAKAANG